MTFGTRVGCALPGTDASENHVVVSEGLSSVEASIVELGITWP